MTPSIPYQLSNIYCPPELQLQCSYPVPAVLIIYYPVRRYHFVPLRYVSKTMYILAKILTIPPSHLAIITGILIIVIHIIPIQF